MTRCATLLPPLCLADARQCADSGPPLSSRLARWADLVLAAPCSASLLCALAAGACDTLAARIVRSAPPNKPVFVYPALNADMFANAFTRRHVAAVKDAGYVVLGPQCRGERRGQMLEWQDVLINVQDMATFFAMRQQQAALARAQQQADADAEPGGSESAAGASGASGVSAPSSALATRESSPGRKSARDKADDREDPNGPPFPYVFRSFAPLWHESAPESYEAGFRPGQQHWQHLPTIATGRTTGLGRAECDLTMPSWERNKESDASTPSLNPIIPLKDKWWA